MALKGLDALQGHVPQLRSAWGLAQALLGIAVVFVLTSLFLLAADLRFPEWMPDGAIVFLALGFLILSRFFSQRKRYQDKFGDSAYVKAFTRFAIPGLGILTAAIGHLAYISGPDIPNQLWWTPWLKGLGYFLVLSGIVLWLRTLAAAGLDSLAMLYVYYPAEGRKLEAAPYSFIRHPIYCAALHLGFGLAFIHASWYALLVAILLPLFFAGWVRLIEEPELLQRWPDYADFRRRVPAFMPFPSAYLRFWRFMLTGA